VTTHISTLLAHMYARTRAMVLLIALSPLSTPQLRITERST